MTIRVDESRKTQVSKIARPGAPGGIMTAMRNKRWLAFTTLVVALIIVSLVIQHVLQKRAEERRLVQYHATVRMYADALQQSTSRAVVEAYLRTRGKAFQQMCCVNTPRNAWADLVNIGEEHVPWFCSQHNIYVAFVFDAPEHLKAQTQTAESTDTLTDVVLYPRLEGCM
jgi:hypothetical protein